MDPDELFECFAEKPTEKVSIKRVKRVEEMVEQDIKVRKEMANQEVHPIEVDKIPITEDVSSNEENDPDDNEFERTYAKIQTINCPESCSHEVAIPCNLQYVPLLASEEQPAKEYKFKLDPFQKEAIQCIENDQSVLVAAHTSAGKTVVAEYAIARSFKKHQRVIYTSPIKALSNQKYRELAEEFVDVGLQTGDVTINPTAGCVVMTTEILRSMLYRGSEIMREVAWVIFDEIHYMRDKERGVVWEETIIMLPHNVRYVFLSATVPNTCQFAEWIARTHNQVCHVISTEFRPTPLRHYVFPVGGAGLYMVVDEKGDFKEKNFEAAISAFESSGEENRTTKRRPKNAGATNIYRLTKAIMKNNYAPAIMFSFSKKECEYYAVQISRLDFNTDDEKRLVQEVFQNALDCLSPEDRKLPQVESVLPLLERGVGIHHSGLLPILKEVTEILFSEGLIKILFSTETFAMGLNMPARTVVFTSCRKYDGSENRWINSGEYIQMSGRAGRRGLDDKGIVILIMDDQITPDVGRSLIKGLPDYLNSAFRLTYNMILNLIRLEGVSPEFMMKRSFNQHQLTAQIPELMEKLELLEKEYNSITVEDEDAINIYLKIRNQLESVRKGMLEYIHDPKYLVPFLHPGRLIKVKIVERDFGWGCVINFQKRTLQNNVGLNEKRQVYLVEALLNCVENSSKGFVDNIPFPWKPGTRGEFIVVSFLSTFITDLSALRITVPDDIRPVPVRSNLLRSIRETESRFPDGIPVLDPVKDMRITETKFKKMMEESSKLEERLLINPIHNKYAIVDSFESKLSEDNTNLKLFLKKTKIYEQIKKIKSELRKVRSIVQLKDLKSRMRVLRRLGYIEGNDMIQIKGRVACEISSADELVLTELLFNGVFNSLTSQQICALLSCFVFQERSNEQETTLSEQLSEPLKMLIETAKRVARVSEESKLTLDSQTYISSFRPDLMDVVYAWANGAQFTQVCKMTNVFEGNIIRCFRRLEELIRQMCQAAKCIGNTELEEKFTECILKIKRNIAFSASLYL